MGVPDASSVPSGQGRVILGLMAKNKIQGGWEEGLSLHGLLASAVIEHFTTSVVKAVCSQP